MHKVFDKLLQGWSEKGYNKNRRRGDGDFYVNQFESVVPLIFVLAGGLGLLAAFDAGALIVFFLSQVSQNAGLCTASLESLKSVVQRLVFLDVNFRHVFPSLQTRLAALQGPTIGCLTGVLYSLSRRLSIISLRS